jgi:formylglycine-generating enzyme required for sulfatase activity
MKTIAYLTILLFVFCCVSPVFGVTFDWATVGNPGNAVDIHGYGSVEYTYCMSKYEVTNAQYTEFLNAVAASDPNGAYSTFMGIRQQGGIIRSGLEGNYTYSVKPDALGQGPGGNGDYIYANKPVNHVSFVNAMRFINWLQNGQPTGAQDASTTEDGVYKISNGTSENRDVSSTYFIPSEDEWYKAAYHKNDGVTGNYWNYPTSTNSQTNHNKPSDDTGNSANFQNGGYTTGNTAYPLTDVGAYALSDSPYGTFDQGGNIWEWNETVIGGIRGLRGGSFHHTLSSLRAAYPFTGLDPMYEDSSTIGFRVAMIPEPSTIRLGALVAIGLLMRRQSMSWHG